MKIQTLLVILCLSTFLQAKKSFKNQAKVHKNKVHKKSKENNFHNRGQGEGVKHLTADLPNQSGDGMHSFKQIQQIFELRDISYAQIKNIFTHADNDHDNLISDSEWANFFDVFVDPFQKCDKDESNNLSSAEFKDCILEEHSKFKNLKSIANDDHQLEQVFNILGAKDINLYDYIYMRRFQNAMNNCAENHLLQPNRIYCAMQITSPRTRRLTHISEKMIYNTAVILADGFLWGQRNGLELIEFLQVAHIYSYMNDYEIQIDENIRKADVMRAIQENVLPKWFTPRLAEFMYADREGDLSFPAWCGFNYMFRIFFSATKGNLFINYDDFKTLITGIQFPGRFNQMIENTYIPSKEEIEQASARLWGDKGEDDYMHNYNNMIFLQKKVRVNNLHKKVRKMRDLPEEEAPISDEDFPTEPQRIMFNMYDSYRNESIYVKDWMVFVTTAFTYMSYEVTSVQRLGYVSISDSKHMNSYIQSNMNVFPYTIAQNYEFTQVLDFMQSNMDYYVNFKEFLSFFRIDAAINFLKQPGLIFRASVKRIIQAFHDVGLRLSHWNKKQHLEGFDSQLSSPNIQFKNAFMTAIQEDIVAQRVKLHRPAKYEQKDNKQ